MAVAEIAGTGLYAPPRVITNAELDRAYGRDLSSFLAGRRNIHERHHLEAGAATSDLVVPAARQALERAGIQAEDLDLIIVSTDTPDYISPATAAVVQHKLGAGHAGTFDLNAACAGFVTALDLAAKYIAADDGYRNVLVAGAYGMSRFLDPEDYKVATVFADGAGCAVVRRAVRRPAEPRFLASALWTDGKFHDHMGIYAGGTAMPASPEALARKDHLLRFVKRIPPETNQTLWPPLIRALLDRSGRKLTEIKRFFFTQINIESIRATMAELGLPGDRAHTIMERYGYTGSAAVGMALADADARGLLAPGDLVVCVASGGGMAMAGLVMEWSLEAPAATRVVGANAPAGARVPEMTAVGASGASP